MSGLETVFASVIAVCALAGLVFSSRILEGKEHFRRQMFVYYTFLSNAAIFLYHTLLLIPGSLQTALRTPVMRFSATLTILVTFLIFFFIITDFGREPPEERPKTSLRRAGNVLVHYVVPLLTLLEWFSVADKQGIGLRGAFAWLIAPGAYLIFMIWYHSLGREIEHTGRSWPYAYVDRERIGKRLWTIRVATIVAGFFVLGLVFAGIAALCSR